ncbi:uncharacterized protein LOC124953303 isoform X2 [Vespa velutina]|uniref:uncharacterized protein LOC124953303 isoform X2 n=1 Tax=Vespa velutina TaxID=202808 RepID=UPI001FB4119A|nr:uncharacterized protein LOC124953303 isoform X2 [Vespa velutina]
MFLLLYLLLIVHYAQAEECFDDGNEFCIDQDDILSVDLLPGSFLFADSYQNKSNSKLEKATVDGTFDKALNEMDYHRKRMNEYLCHGYMAEEIVKEVSIPRVKRKPNSAPSKPIMPDFLGNDNVTIHEKMLWDEGSSKYKNWLQKTLKKKQGIKYDHDIEEFDGEVTGFAMQAPLPSGKIEVYEPPNSNEDHMPAASGHNYHHYGYGHGEHFGHPGEFFPAIQEEHYYHVPYHQEQQEHEEEHHKPVYHSKGKGHDLSLKDFFEIALTALAFLAFGLFVIQLLMNATQNMTNVTTSSSLTDASDGTRFKRHVGGFPMTYATNQELNELSYRVLRSVEAALIADMDSANCLRRILCEDNQYSKSTNDGRKIWVPVWSLGMSWITGRVSKAAPWSAMLESVKASVLGLGGANCTLLYPNCDLRKERIKRRRRRRR